MRPNNDAGRTDDEQLLTPDLPPPVEGVPDPGPAPEEKQQGGDRKNDKDKEEETQEQKGRSNGAREESDAPEPPD